MSHIAQVTEAVRASEPGAGSTSSSARRVERLLAGVAVFLGLLLLGIFFGVPYLPMVDLPQHAAQISVWLHLGDKSFAGVENFRVNLRTPYLTGYALARWLGAWLGVVPGLKLAIWLSVVAQFGAFALLVRKLGHPFWVSLFGLPFAFGYSFYFGFVSFLAAVPFVLLALTLALWHRERASVLTGSALALALAGAVVSHGFACGVALAMVGPLLLRGAGHFFVRVAPLGAPLLVSWLLLSDGDSARKIGATIWDPRFFELAQVPSLMLSASGGDAAATAFGVFMLAAMSLGVGRPSREPERWLPLLLVVAGFCLFPAVMGGFGPLHPRFASFFPAALLLGFEPKNAPGFKLLPGVAAALCGAWCAVFGVRTYAFSQEAAPVRNWVKQMPAGLRVRPIVFERESEAFPGAPMHLHMSAYYLAEKGGIQGYSFAMYPTSVIRYVPGFVPGMGGGAEWHPERFSALKDVPRFDCFLVHSEMDRSVSLFGDLLSQVELVFHEGNWWAYRVRPQVSVRRQKRSWVL
ncbi:MAG: hypothetical protein SFV15_13240 [Polyangiaceae bacterium]|nr:hypothetical protein [Polyangiaceae bacterium]